MRQVHAANWLWCSSTRLPDMLVIKCIAFAAADHHTAVLCNTCDRPRHGLCVCALSSLPLFAISV